MFIWKCSPALNGICHVCFVLKYCICNYSFWYSVIPRYAGMCSWIIKSWTQLLQFRESGFCDLQNKFQISGLCKLFKEIQNFAELKSSHISQGFAGRNLYARCPQKNRWENEAQIQWSPPTLVLQPCILQPALYTLQATGHLWLHVKFKLWHHNFTTYPVASYGSSMAMGHLWLWVIYGYGLNLNDDILIWTA